MVSYEFSYTFNQFGFFSTAVSNSLFVYLTLFHIRKITGTYRIMVIVFAILGIVFSSWELVARPFAHNYNKALVYFSLNEWLQEYHEFLKFAIILYASFYLVILSDIAVQFTYRYFTLYKPQFSNMYGGFGIIVWASYSLISGAIYGGSMYYFCPPDSYSDHYSEEVIQDVYHRNITNIPRFLVVPYADDGSVRWKNLYFLMAAFLVVGLQYTIIIYCGVRMNSILQKEFRQRSIINQRLHSQFFRALVVQTIVPTFLFVLPIAPFLIGPLVIPYIGFSLNFQTGWMYVILSIYPPIDTIAFMVIVSEYAHAIQVILNPVLPKSMRVASDYSTSTRFGSH